MLYLSLCSGIETIKRQSFFKCNIFFFHEPVLLFRWARIMKLKKITKKTMNKDSELRY